MSQSEFNGLNFSCSGKSLYPRIPGSFKSTTTQHLLPNKSFFYLLLYNVSAHLNR